MAPINPQLQHITIGGTAYPVIFNSHAAYLLDDFLKKNSVPSSAVEVVRNLLRNKGSFYDAVHAFYACLEGGRVREATRLKPFTIPEVCGLIDELGESAPQTLAAILQPTVEAAMPAPEEGAPRPNERARGGTGKRSSQTRQKSASAPKTSGG